MDESLLLDKYDKLLTRLVNKYTHTAELLSKLVELAEYDHKKTYETWFFSYPRDGTRATLSAGMTVLDFDAGTIKAPDGTITDMSTSLRRMHHDYMRSVAINTNKDIVIQLDDKDKIPVRANNWFIETYQSFTRVKITTTASTEAFLHASTNPKTALEMVNEVTAVSRRIDTDKDTQFTTAIAQNAIEEENITGLSDNKITITGIAFQAKEALSYRLWVFGTDGFADTDLDADQFIKYVDFDFATANGQIAGAGQYYLAQTDLNIDYEDEDATNELHLALQNLSASAKTADADGEVKVKVSYKPRM